jgi:hypothetical protein
MRRQVLLFCLMLFFAVSSFAQFNQKNRKQSNDDDESSSFFDKLYFAGGGGFGAGTNAFGQRYNYYSLLPTVGYRVSREVLVGINISYSKYTYPDYGISYSQTGYAPFVRYYLQQLFFQVEYDLISANIPDANSQGLYDDQKKYYDRLFLGLGFSQRVGKRAAINAMGMYDVLYKQYPAGPFLSPFAFRVFFSY